MAMKLHFAVQVDLEHTIKSVAALKAAGLEPLSGTGQPIDEPEVIPWIPSASVYFHDPDGHSLEFIAMLPDAPATHAKNMPLSRWLTLQRSGGAESAIVRG
jgi:lactoylglutathione lyase